MVSVVSVVWCPGVGGDHHLVTIRPGVGGEPSSVGGNGHGGEGTNILLATAAQCYLF